MVNHTVTLDGNTLTGVLSKGDKTLADYAANSNGVSVAKALSVDPALLGALADATKDEVRKTLSSLANDIHVTANAMTVANGQSLARAIKDRAMGIDGAARVSDVDGGRARLWVSGLSNWSKMDRSGASKLKSDFYTGLIGLEADINANNKVGVFFGAGKTKFKGGHDGKIDSNDLHFGIYGQSKFEPVRLDYTKEEIEKYFSPYLACAARALDLTRSELLGALMRHYDGFCFERSATERVFAPWSLLNFFASPRNGLLDYWFESGGKPSVLMEYLKSHAMRSPEEYGREKTISLSTLSGSSDADTLSDLGLLTQTGYLTIKAVKYGDTVYLDYPNLEVKKAMGQLYVEHLLTGRSAGQVGAGPIVQVLSEESAEALVHILNRLFAAIDYQRYPVRDEASVRAFTQVYFAGAGLEPKVEHHTAHGRSDLEVKVNNRHWILEFKVSRDQENPDQKLEEAVEQLKLKGYGDDSSSENLIKVALVFSLEERKFIRWKEV